MAEDKYNLIDKINSYFTRIRQSLRFYT